MKRLLLSLLFVAAGLFVVDRIGGQLMWWVNQHTQDVSGPKIKYLINEVHEDVLLLGTSRCNLHYVPSILQDTLEMSVYNGGIDASHCIYAHYFIFNHVLAHHTPKLVCVELSEYDYLPEGKRGFETISFFGPYAGKNAAADSVFRDAGTWWKYQLSHLYRYNAKAVSNIAGLWVSRQSGEDHGYLPNPKPAQFPNSLEDVKTPKGIDTQKLDYLNRFISLCEKRSIQLVFMVSPAYTVAAPDLYDVLKQLAAERHIPFLDYHSEGLYLDHPEYFKDAEHLWDQGARLYTARFAHDLLELLRYKE